MQWRGRSTRCWRRCRASVAWVVRLGSGRYAERDGTAMKGDGDSSRKFAVPAFLVDGGELGALMRSHAWDETPLGPVERWPAALRTLTGVMLGSRQPMFLTWGPERVMLYNDGYGLMLGERHPGALGRPFPQVWFDILDDVGPILDRAYAGEATHMDDIALVMTRNGTPEQTHFAFSYTPVRDEAGVVRGMFCACTVTTETVRAQQSIREMAEAARETNARLQLVQNAGGSAVSTGTCGPDKSTGRLSTWRFRGSRRIRRWTATSGRGGSNGFTQTIVRR